MARSTLTACPDCGDTDNLATIEELTGTAAFTGRRNGDTVTVDHDGYTDIDWNSSTTVGVTCGACGYEYRGGDWQDVLT